MIEAHVGLPGSGKTLHAAERLRSARKRGRRALANFHSQSASWEFALWPDMIEAANCLCVIDEAHMWFSARTWSKNEQLELSYFQQHRKEGIDLVWVAQHENRVDVAIRELTAFIWRHRRIGRFCIASRVTPDEPKKVIGRRVVRIRPELYNDFFTEERIGQRDGKGYRFGSGEAYKRSAGGSPELDENYRLRPNFFRIESPSNVRYLPADGPGISEAVALALMESRLAGYRGQPEGLCRPCYRGADGRFHELDLEGALQPNEAQKDIIEQALALFQDLRRQVVNPSLRLPMIPKGSFNRSPLKLLMGSSHGDPVKDVAAATKEPVRECESLIGSDGPNALGLRGVV